MKDLNIGVIGAQGRGRLAGNAHRPADGVRLVGAADVNPEALEYFRKTYGEDTFRTDDYRKLLKRKDIDAVFVCSPDFLHEEQAIASLKAGKAVYLEKPMAISIEGCDKILKTAYETKSKLYLGHNMRHFPVVLKMKELIDSGIVGEVQSVWCRHFISYGGDAYFKDWHSERKYSTGLLLQKAAHDIDVIHWLSGSYTAAVVGMGKLSVYDRCKKRKASEKGNAGFDSAHWPPLEQTGFSPKIDVEDHSMIMMQLANGVQCSYMQSHYSPDSWRNYTVIGTKGRMENFGDHGNCSVEVRTSRDAASPDFICNLHEIAGSHGGADPRIVNEFIEFVRKGIKTNTSPVAARNAVAAGVMGTESLRNGSCLKAVTSLPKKLIEYFENGQQS